MCKKNIYNLTHHAQVMKISNVKLSCLLMEGEAAVSDISNQQLHKFKERALGDKYFFYID